MPNIHAQVAVRKSRGAANKSNTGPSKEDGRHIEGWSGRWRDSLKAMLPEELRSLRNIAQYMPLIAAIAAPMSTLMDIPALSVRSLGKGFLEHLPSVANRCRSNTGTATTVTCNPIPQSVCACQQSAFSSMCSQTCCCSSDSRQLRSLSGDGVSSGSKCRLHSLTTCRLSLLCWITKTILAIVNLLVFGAGQRNGPGYSYDQGFWCAVVSCIISGCISFCLLVHYLLVFGKPEWDKEEIRLEGRKFMLSVTTFIGLIGIQAMVFNFIEEWGYLNAIYFSVQTALTVGYGDYVPTTAVGKVLIFPFAVLTISLLANEVSIIIDFIQNRAQDKRDKWRKNYAVAMHKEALARQPYATLIDEMSLIHQINLHQET